MSRSRNRTGIPVSPLMPIDPIAATVDDDRNRSARSAGSVASKTLRMAVASVARLLSRSSSVDQVAAEEQRKKSDPDMAAATARVNRVLQPVTHSQVMQITAVMQETGQPVARLAEWRQPYRCCGDRASRIVTSTNPEAREAAGSAPGTAAEYCPLAA